MIRVKISHEEKESFLEALKEQGTMLAASIASGVKVRVINKEMLRSEIYRRRILEARAEGYRNIADKAIEQIKLYASGVDAEGKPLRTDRNVLTANIALANWAQPGFRGQTVIQGRIEHDVRVITAVPRPKYEITEVKPKQIDKGKENPYNITEGEVINDNNGSGSI